MAYMSAADPPEQGDTGLVLAMLHARLGFNVFITSPTLLLPVAATALSNVLNDSKCYTQPNLL